jgi:hypothetical protein
VGGLVWAKAQIAAIMIRAVSFFIIIGGWMFIVARW